VRKVNFHVEDTRVGQMTDYDKLILEVWTNGSISPTQAIVIGFILWVLLVFILVKWQKNETRFVALAGFFFLLGVWRVMVAEVNCASPNAVCFYNGNLVEIIGTIIREPDRRVDKTNYVVEVSNLGGGAVRGAVLVSYGAYPRYDYGDTIQILSCKELISFTAYRKDPKKKEHPCGALLVS
jgi:hypothetical protein